MKKIMMFSLVGLMLFGKINNISATTINLDPDKNITLPMMIFSNVDIKITIRDLENYKTYYQQIPLTEEEYKKYFSEYEKCNDETKVLKDEYKSLEDIYVEIRNDSSATTEEIEEAKEKYSNKIDEYNSKITECENIYLSHIKDYDATKWIEFTDNKITDYDFVNSGILWIKVSTSSNDIYDAQIYGHTSEVDKENENLDEDASETDKQETTTKVETKTETKVEENTVKNPKTGVIIGISGLSLIGLALLIMKKKDKFGRI